MKFTVKEAAALVEVLRNTAKHIEDNGPAVLLDCNLFLNFDYEQIDFGRGRLAPCGVKSITLEGKVNMRDGLLFAPSCGIKPVRSEPGPTYRWDGQPPRAPKKGEHYLSADAPTWVSLATRDLKKPRHIMQECS
jgi:hypothetical protein